MSRFAPVEPGDMPQAPAGPRPDSDRKAGAQRGVGIDVRMLRRVLLIIGGLLLLVVAALGITLALLDIDGLIAKYKPKALAAASEAVGRDVEVGVIDSTWFPDLAIVANDIVVASSTVTKTEAPMVEVESLRLSVAIWDALISLGRDVAFDEIVLVEPVVRVRQRPDGTWNFASLGPDEKEAPAPEEQMSDRERKGFVDRLERATIDRIAIVDGHIVYEDPQQKFVARDLDLEVLDLALGQPVNASLALAFAADQQNVMVDVTTEPLPKTMLGFTPPALKSVTLNVTDLPIDGFLPEVEGYDLKRVALNADLTAEPSEGEVSLGGTVSVGPINWVEGPQTGSSFSVGSTIDATYELESGEVSFSDTKIELGPLMLEIMGKASTTEPVTGRAKVETTRAVRLSQLAPLAPGLDGLPPAALTVAFDASSSEDAVVLDSIVVGLANATLRGRARYPWGVKERLTGSFDTGEVDLNLLMKNLEIEGTALPDGSHLLVQGDYAAPVATPAEGRVNLSKIDFVAGESRLDARGSITRLSPLVARLEGKSPHLNLDELMPPPSEDEPPPADEPATSSGLEDISVTTVLDVDEVVYSGVTARDARATIVLEDEQLVLERLRFDVFGGRFSAAGTSLDLSEDPIAYHLAAKIQSLQASEFMGLMSDTLGRTLSGELSTDIDLDGAGFDMASIAKTLSGSLAMTLTGGELSGVDLIGSAAQPVSKALKVTNFEPSKRLVTDFRRLAATFTVEDGRFLSTKPLSFDTPGGDITLDGSIGLDQTVSLSGQVELSPDFIRSLSGGRVRPDRPIPVGLRLGCELTSPCVEGVDAEPAVAALAKAAAGELVSEAKERLEERTGVDIDEARDEVKERAEEKAKDVAKDAAKKAKEKAEDELKSIFGR